MNSNKNKAPNYSMLSNPLDDLNLVNMKKINKISIASTKNTASTTNTAKCESTANNENKDIKLQKSLFAVNFEETQNSKKCNFVEVGPELTIEENNPSKNQPSLQMILLFNLFWIDRFTAENILIFLAETYGKFPIIFRHMSNRYHQKSNTKYIAISLATINHNLNKEQQTVEKIQQTVEKIQQNVEKNQQTFLTPIVLKNKINLKLQHFQFAVLEENGILILTNPEKKIKFRDLDSLTDREIFGTQEFYENRPTLRDELKQRFGCFC